MSGEAEPRRSVRATKGQHTKTFDELEQVAVTKCRQTKKSKKAQEQEQSQEPEEVIRCICGATEQDEDSGEAWISCETCFVWQHNVCVGVSSFEDEIPENYWCEQCRPQDHKELLEGLARGEKPWEARRKAHELEVAEKKKRRGGRRVKGKRNSDHKDAKDTKEEHEKYTDRSKSKASLTPEVTVPKDKKESGAKQGKRKSREDSHDVDGKNSKLRRVSDRDGPATVRYTPPVDLAASIEELPGTRVGPAKALKKSLAHVISAMAKNQELKTPEDSTEYGMAEQYALQIERAVFDTHPVGRGHKEYNQQIKSLTFNLKNNPELFHGLLEGIHSPATLAIMTSEQLASAEMQRQTAEMRARAEKQSILYTHDTGLRVRRTHKGEEVVEDDNMLIEAPIPMAGGPRRGVAAGQAVGKDNAHESTIKRESNGGDRGDNKNRSASQAELTQQSPSQPNFDINKVFSTVKSPTVGHHRKPSLPIINTKGPGIDPDVDRMLEDGNESPPYSPTEEAQDPDVVWRGSLAMSSIADFPATAKHVGGANFSIIGPWSKLIPKRMTVAGRISQQSAIEYLCSLRYSNLTDIVVVSLTPASAGSRHEFNNLIDYFITKNRYGVVGNKVAGNVRDTYLVPVPAGEDGHPEFMLNLVDNFIPKSRTEPMLLAVFVYRSEPDQIKQYHESANAPPTSATATPTPAATQGAQRSNSSFGPVFSPATPQGVFTPQQQQQQQQQQQAPPGPSQSQQQALAQPKQPPHNSGPLQSTTPVPIPQPPYAYRAAQGPPTTGAPASSQAQPASTTTSTPALPPAAAQAPGQMTETQKYQSQMVGQTIAHEVLGSLISSPTVQFLLPQAFQMTRREWEVVKGVYEREPRSRDDLQYLGALLEKEGAENRAENLAMPTSPAGRKL